MRHEALAVYQRDEYRLETTSVICMLNTCLDVYDEMFCIKKQDVFDAGLPSKER